MKTQSDVFDRLEAELGSRYAAINYVAKLANDIYNEYCGQLSKSEILSWILDNKRPKHLSLARYRAKYAGIEKFTAEIDYLNYVSDPEIVDSVKETLNNALRYNNLTYIYQGDLQESQKSRIRVISNILWARIKEELS